MVQTPQQRRANEKFARDQQARMGKSKDTVKKPAKVVSKSPISVYWLVVLAFVIFGGILFDLIFKMIGR